MRICDINDQYSPTGGGIRTYHLKKLEYFKSNPNHEAALVIPGDCCSRKTDGNTSIYKIDSIPMAGSGYRLVVEDSGIDSMLTDFQPDIIEIGSPYLLPWLTKRALGGLNIPTVGFYHCDFPDCYVRPIVETVLPGKAADLSVRVASGYAGLVYSQMTAVFGATRVVLRKLRKAGVKRLFLTPLGVDTELFTPNAASELLRRDLGITGGKKLLLYMARIQKEKGIDQLMRVYPLIRRPAAFTLVIAGRGPLSSRVDSFVEKYPEVKRLQYISSREDAAELMASADVYLSLGHAESFGLAGLEAISSGTLPVFTDSGGACEMAEDLGMLSPYENADIVSLASSIGKAFATLDGTTVSKLRAYAEPRGWKGVFQRMELFYSRIIEAHRKGDIESLESPDGWWEV